MRPLLCFVVLLSTFVRFAAQEVKKGDKHAMHGLHADAKAYIDELEDPKRGEYQKPYQVMMALDLKAGETIADIGAGSGYFALRFAQHAGEQGRVYAVDVNPEMILHLNRRVRELGLKNIVSILAPPDDPLLADGSLDRVFICNSWHHIEKRPAYLSLLKKMLKPGGQLVMIDH
ncbi:MAG: class I SAM-dependent methyltransferase [Acidimicrobiia bacterium]|nr:class I SAM-dependent methyltransferase [Acidimicrobiia bacterium]